MTAPVPTNEPLELRAGLTWVWTRDFSDYPATSWLLTYWFKQLAASGAKFSIVASANGAQHSVSVAAATTAAYTADDYSWAAVVTSGSEAYEVDRGNLRILPKYNADSALDDRSHARKMLEAVETALETFSTNATVKSYTIGSRTLTRRDVPELMALRDKYRAEVYAEECADRAANGIGAARLVARL